MRKLLLVCVLISSAVIYYACQRDDLSGLDRKAAKELAQIQDAKAWFGKHLATITLDPVFENTRYHWDKAKIFDYKNGNKAITVPVTENDLNPKYHGRRILYLFPWKNGKGYYSTIYEVIATPEHMRKNEGRVALKTFNGYISTWDLQTGFSRGARYINGVPDRNISIEYRQMSQAKPGDIREDIDLPTFTVVGYSPASNGGYYITLMSSLGIGTSLLWGGGGSGNPCEYSNCNFSNNPLDYFDQGLLDELAWEQYDDQWTDEEIIDSTDNPCATDVLSVLASIDAQLPELIRDFLSADADFNMTIRMNHNDDWGTGGRAPDGGSTVPNTTTDDFDVYLNDYYSEATDLSIAATIIHEAFHCQLMSWFQDAIRNNDVATQEQLATDYGYVFSPMFDVNNSLSAIVNGGNATQHQDMMTRYQNTIANALLQFAQSKGIDADLNYCKDMAWAGSMDSKAFKDKSYNDRSRIMDRVNSERDPYSNLSDGSYSVNPNNTTPKGKPCPPQ